VNRCYREKDYFVAPNRNCHGIRPYCAEDEFEGKPMKTKHKAPIRRCGEIIGRASAGLIVVGTAGFALAAAMMDLL